jgi:hypothetical protein
VKLRILMVGALAAGLIGFSASALRAEDKDEVKVTIDQVPAPVKATLEKESSGGTISEIEKDTTEGKTVYEADATIGGKKYEIKVAEDGTLLTKKLDDEEDDDKEDDDKK